MDSSDVTEVSSASKDQVYNLTVACIMTGRRLKQSRITRSALLLTPRCRFGGFDRLGTHSHGEDEIVILQIVISAFGSSFRVFYSMGKD